LGLLPTVRFVGEVFGYSVVLKEGDEEEEGKEGVEGDEGIAEGRASNPSVTGWFLVSSPPLR